MLAWLFALLAPSDVVIESEGLAELMASRIGQLGNTMYSADR